jgi:hypothetical protein
VHQLAGAGSGPVAAHSSPPGAAVPLLNFSCFFPPEAASADRVEGGAGEGERRFRVVFLRAVGKIALKDYTAR